MRIGLLGGMSWESSLEYYRLVNQEVRQRLGGLHSADCLLRSVDFAPVEQLQRTGRWDQAGELLAGEAQTLVAAGAQLLVLCTNTMHKLADRITDAVGIPLVHIADTTAQAVRAAGMTSVGLLATAYTMEQDFYVGRLRDRHVASAWVALAVVVASRPVASPARRGNRPATARIRSLIVLPRRLGQEAYGEVAIRPACW